jgi:hypothetical protein
MRVLLPAGSGRRKEFIPQRVTVDQIEGHSRTTRVGVNISKYQDRVTDALPTVEEAQQGLPAGPLKSALTKAITAYKDAATLWSRMVSFPEVSLRSSGIGNEQILDRYGIKKLTFNEQTKIVVRDGLEGILVDNQITLSTIWQAAAEAIKTAKAMQ